MKTKPTPPFPALQSASTSEAVAAAAVAARAPAPAPAPGPATVDIPVSKRDVSAFDAVNLNVDGDAGVTMTFVESLDGDDEDDE